MIDQDITLAKKEVRARIKMMKASLTSTEMEEKSQVICERVFQILKDKEPSIISLFLSMPDEVKTGHLIDLLWSQGKHEVVIPRVEDKTTMRFYTHLPSKPLAQSKFGILEPLDEISDERIPVIMIVPGVAFDLNGGRIGYGRGYYDRYFMKYSEVVTERIAIGYDLQVIDEVPMDQFDQRMTGLVTEERSIVFGS